MTIGVGAAPTFFFSPNSWHLFPSEKHVSGSKFLDLSTAPAQELVTYLAVAVN
jgi:hypothetical protein